MLTSTRNPRVRAAAALARRRERVATGTYLVEGPNAVGEALRDGVVVELLATPDAAASLAPGLVPAEVDLVLVAEHVLQRVADSRAPQGLVAVARTRTTSLDDVVGQDLLLGCTHVADPGNCGALVRVTDAVGARALVLGAGSVDPENPKAVRAAAGSLGHTDVVTDADPHALLQQCAARGQRTVVLDAGRGPSIGDLAAEVGAGPAALLAGSEAHGVPGDVLAAADAVAHVPMRGRAESLNLAVAVAVAAYTWRERTRPDGPRRPPAR